jgi:hypothetical protein
VNLPANDGTTYVVVDPNGNRWEPGPRPYGPAFTLAQAEGEISVLEQADAEVFRIIEPIRDVLMYLPESVSDQEWAELTLPLEDLNIRTVSSESGPADDWVLSNKDVLTYARQFLGWSTVVPIGSYLMEAELALKCYYFVATGEAVDMSDGEGHDYCRDRLGIDTRQNS